MRERSVGTPNRDRRTMPRSAAKRPRRRVASSSGGAAWVLLSLLAAFPSAALAFAPPRPSPRHAAPRTAVAPATTTTLRSTTEDEVAAAVADSTATSGASTTTEEEATKNGWTIGSKSRTAGEAARKRKVAEEALNKLLERQQRDVRQTLDLLADLEREFDRKQHEEGSAVFDEEFDVASFLAGGSSMMTASVAAGADYGFASRSQGCPPSHLRGDLGDARFEGYGPPGNVLSLGSQQFVRNLRAMIGEYRDEEEGGRALTSEQRERQSKLKELTLDSDAIWARERKRGAIVAPWIIKVPYFALCYLLDGVFEGRDPFGRFFLLETVARMPYFSYISMLHLYETLGFWRRSADVKRIHFAEEWNEFHHLLIMESLGGDQSYWVRFLAQHSALAYYVALCVLWMMSPSLSYKFSEMLETHAVDTYGQFVDENEEKLRQLPPSLAAVEYYTVGVTDPMFGEYQTASVSNPHRDGVRRPGTDMRSLYDVFVAIRNDEGDHVQTMESCLDPDVATLSPGLEGRVLTGVALAAGANLLLGGGGQMAVDGLNELSEALANGGAEGLGDAADGVTDSLDSILSSEGAASGALNALAGRLAGMANGLQAIIGTDAEIDDDVAGSALEDIAASGVDGFEMEAFFEVVRSVLVGILELIGLGL